MQRSMVTEYLAPHRLADGTFPRYVHGHAYGCELATVHGDQFLPPWHLHPRGVGYCIDDFGTSVIILDEAERQRLRGEERH